MAKVLSHNPATAGAGMAAGLGAQVGRLLGWIRKSEPEAPGNELLRLAETSPHLLRDVGLSEAGGPGSGLWSDGTRHVSVPHRTPADVLLRSGRF